jgi:hypothetical protein
MADRLQFLRGNQPNFERMEWILFEITNKIEEFYFYKAFIYCQLRSHKKINKKNIDEGVAGTKNVSTFAEQKQNRGFVQ